MERGNFNFIGGTYATSLFFLLVAPLCCSIKFENINQTTFSVVVGEEQSIAIKYKESNKALILLKMEEQQLNIIKYENKSQTTCSVVVGEEQSIAIKYKERNKALILLKVEKEQLNINESSWILIQNYYIMANQTQGRIILHFQKVQQSDLGSYRITYQEPENKTCSIISFLLSGISLPVSSSLLILYIVPTACVVVCLLVIIVSIYLVKKSRTSSESLAKKTASEKNFYVKSNKSQSVKQASDTTQTTNNSINQQAPATNLKTTSPHPNVHQLQPVSFPAPYQGHTGNANFRKSMNSIDSFEDCEEDYVNTSIPNSRVTFNNGREMIPSNQSLSDRCRFNSNTHQRFPTAPTSPQSALMPPTMNPKSNRFYQNRFKAQPMANNCEEDDIYESM